MRKLIILLIFVLNFGYLVTQASEITDSLLIKLEQVRAVGDNQKEEARLLLHLTYYYSYSNSNKAIQYGNECLELSRKLGNKNTEAQALSYIAAAEKELGNNVEAIEKYVEAANIFHELGNTHYVGHSYSSISKTYGNIGDKKNALFYYKKAHKILTALSDTLYTAAATGNMGEYHRLYGNIDSAIFYFTTANQQLETIKDGKKLESAKHYRETHIGNLGMIYLEKGDFQKAKAYLQEATAYFMLQGDTYRASVYQSELGKIAIQEGDEQEGLTLINISLEMAQNENLKEQIRDFNELLSSVYEEQQDYPKALFHYQQYKTYDDSIKNVENVRKMEQLQSDFQLSRKDEEISNLNKVNRLQRNIGILLMLGVIFVMVMVYFLYNANRRIKAYNQEITLQKELIEKREAEKALLLRELNHRVKNNLQMVASLLSLHARQLKGHPAADALMAGKYRVEALTLIHQKLYRDDVDTLIDIKDYIDELVKNLVMNFGPAFRLELALIPFIIKIDKAIPLGLILNELITNSLKYGQQENENPLLSLAIIQKEDDIVIRIQDNGKGLPEDFDFRNATSFGLKLVHSLIGQLKGTISWKSDNGTCWTITLNSLNLK